MKESFCLNCAAKRQELALTGDAESPENILSC
jgi:hypothetical protein